MATRQCQCCNAPMCANAPDSIDPMSGEWTWGASATICVGCNGTAWRIKYCHGCMAGLTYGLEFDDMCCHCGYKYDPLPKCPKH